MDIFKFNNPNAPTKMEQGRILNGFTNKMWVERYRDAGEFTLTAPVSTGMRDLLPTGSFISHTNTDEIMIVENHDIKEQRGQDSNIVITGRSLETILEGRVVGANKTFPISGTLSDYPLAADYTWGQTITLLLNHIVAGVVLDPNDAIPYITPIQGVPGTGASAARTLKRGDLYQRVLELLAIDNLGVKVVRPGPTSPVVGHGPDTALVIYKGVDKTKSVVYTYEAGEIESAEYLWSIKGMKNAALITGKWVETRVVPADAGIARKWMFIDGSSIDQNQTAAPTGTNLTIIVTAMQQMAAEILASQNTTHLVSADVSKESLRAVYRKDYNLGDIIGTIGNYNEGKTLRVNEYVEIEDETGEKGYPTFAADN